MEAKNEMKRLEKLIGNWTLTGRSLDSETDDIKGTASFEWILDGLYILHKSTMEAGGMKIESLSIIGYDQEANNFPEMIYMNFANKPIEYFWDIDDNGVYHWTDGAKYSGEFKNDGKVLVGGWRAIGENSNFKNPYDALMTKV